MREPRAVVLVIENGLVRRLMVWPVCWRTGYDALDG